MFAVITWTPDGTHHVSLWSNREKAEAHAPKTIANSQLAKLDLEWVVVVEIDGLDTGQNIATAYFDDDDD